MKRNIIFILVSIVSMCLLADYFTGKTITRKLIGQVTTKKKTYSIRPTVRSFISETNGKLNYELIYQSPEKRYYLMTGNTVIPASSKKEYNKLICYELRISSNKYNDLLKSFTENELTEKLNYLNSKIQLDFKIIHGKDTLPCVMAHFERNYGVAPYLSIQIAFENSISLNNQDYSILYDDHLFNNGTMHLYSKI